MNDDFVGNAPVLHSRDSHRDEIFDFLPLAHICIGRGPDADVQIVAFDEDSMTESVSPPKASKRASRRPNFNSILKAAKAAGASSVEIGEITIRLTTAPPMAPNTEDTEDIKSIL